MPPPHRLAGDVVVGLLDRWFPAQRTLVPSRELGARIVERCSAAGIEGGAVYDALVALTAAEATRTLVTLDLRAVRTYRQLAIDFQLLE
jgi:hypothetical protein